MGLILKTYAKSLTKDGIKDDWYIQPYNAFGRQTLAVKFKA